MSEWTVLIKTILESNPGLFDQMVLRRKRKYISHLSEVFRLSRIDLENAWDLIQTTQRPWMIPGTLQAICTKFRSEGIEFSIERISEMMVTSSGNIEA